jgi:hypothetical protein
MGELDLPLWGLGAMGEMGTIANCELLRITNSFLTFLTSHSLLLISKAAHST